jgi:monofunctional biosynthetic peptidoglycan transglycosylase
LTVSAKLSPGRRTAHYAVTPRQWLRIVACLPLAAVAFVVTIIIGYRFIDPPLSAFMAGHAMAGEKIRHQWVDMSDISRRLPVALIVSEDANFCDHWGVDWSAVETALDEANSGRRQRGASTIAMQTAKNLFLWPGRSYVRKVLEVPLAYAMTALWPKRRMLEIYMNIAEWGPGIFGAEAAARHHFKKSAAKLTRFEAALLAASLPNPRLRNAGRPGPTTRRLASIVQKRMLAAGPWVRCINRHG